MGGTKAWSLGSGMGGEKVGADVLALTPQFIKALTRHSVNLGSTGQKGAGTDGETFREF